MFRVLFEKINRQKMVRCCCVKSCKESWFPNSYTSFFAFPFNNEEMKEKWLKAAPGYKSLSKHSSICSKHFLSDDYTECGGRRKLKKNAVPSVFGPRCVDICNKTLDSNIIHERECSFFREEPQIITLLRSGNQCDAMTQISSNNFEGLERNDKSTKTVSVQTCPRLSGPSEREKELVHKIHILQGRLRRREKMITNVKNLVASLKKAGKSTDNLEDKFLKTFTKFDLELFKNEANNNNVGKNGKTYTDEMKEFARTLYSISPRAYRFVRTKINLPHSATLRRWIGESIIETIENEIRSEEIESNEMENIESTNYKIQAVKSTEVEEVESHESTAIETTAIEEVEITEIEEAEEAEANEIKEITTYRENEESTDCVIEEVESTEIEDAESTEIQEAEPIEIEDVKSHRTEENRVTSRLPVLIARPVDVSKDPLSHETLKQNMMKAIPILSKKQGFKSVRVILKR